MKYSAKKYFVDRLGINSRLDEIQAAILSIKLKHLDRWNLERNRLAKLYLKKLDGIGDIVLPQTASGSSHVYHLFVIRTQRRDQLQRFLASKGIETLIHYPVPPHLQNAYAFKGYRSGMYPIAEECARTCLSLPLWPLMGETNLETIVNKVELFFGPSS